MAGPNLVHGASAQCSPYFHKRRMPRSFFLLILMCMLVSRAIIFSSRNSNSNSNSNNPITTKANNLSTSSSWPSSKTPHHSPKSTTTTTSSAGDRDSSSKKINIDSTRSKQDDGQKTHRKNDEPDPQPYVPPSSLPIKTLVVLIGNLRCGELAWTSLYDNLLDWNNGHNTSDVRTPHVLDLALAIGDEVEEMYQNASLFGRAKYVFTFHEYGDDWSEALDLIDPSWKVKVAPLLSNSSIVLGGVRYRNWHGSGAISFWIRWFLSQKIVEHDLVSRYDRFVITRTDHFYMCPHDLSALDPRFLWVPWGGDFGGITDRHHVVPSQHVLSALNILPGLFQQAGGDPTTTTTATATATAALTTLYPSLHDMYYNPEQLLRDRWKQEGLYGLVKRFPRMMFTCGNAVADDTTRWKTTGEIVVEGVRKKYRKEYMQSEETCKAGDDHGAAL